MLVLFPVQCRSSSRDPLRRVPTSQGLQEPLPHPARHAQACVFWWRRNRIGSAVQVAQGSASSGKRPTAFSRSGAGPPVMPVLPGGWLCGPRGAGVRPARGRDSWRGREEWQAGHLGAAGRPVLGTQGGHPARLSHSAVPLRKDNGAQLLGINNSGTARDRKPGP